MFHEHYASSPEILKSSEELFRTSIYFELAYCSETTVIITMYCKRRQGVEFLE